METKNLLLSILFLKGKSGIDFKEAASLLKTNKKQIEFSIQEIKKDIKAANLPFDIKVNEEVVKLTLSSAISKHLAEVMPKIVYSKLSKTNVEVLTIIAYKQPVTKSEIDDIRGLGSDNSIEKLLSLDLIKESGRLNKTGKPIIYETTDYFLEAFNLKSLSELPKMDKEDDSKTVSESELFDFN